MKERKWIPNISVKYLGDNKWELLEDLSFLDVTIGKSFIYNGASTPRLLWFVIPPMQDTAYASCVHDYMCQNAKTKKDRKKADRYFLALLLTTSKLNIMRCLAGYFGVRIGALLGVGGP